MDHQKRFEIITRKLRDHGHKITPQRLAIAEILAKSENHPSVENIHIQVKKNFPTMSLATVYRNIVLIKSLGEVLELAQMFRGRVVDVGRNSLMIELSGPEDKLEAFVDLLRPYGIQELARTGVIAMQRAEQNQRARHEQESESA